MMTSIIPMRRSLFKMNTEESQALLARAPVIHIATSAGDDHPIFRSMHGVLIDDFMAFHSSPVGEKVLALGRRAVLSAEEIIVDVPSYFSDPVNACPATTFYESVQAHGVLTKVEDITFKGRIMQGIMERYQPDGGYLSIAENLPYYRKALEGILVFGMTIENICGKSKCGQNWSGKKLDGVLKRLWERGKPGDATAIERILKRHPGKERPDFLTGPGGCQLMGQLTEEGDFHSAGSMLEGQYWNEGLSKESIIDCLKNTETVVGVKDSESGELIACGRASGDRRRFALISDVVVSEAWRGRGIGCALMTLLLDHPNVRRVSGVSLRTRDAQDFYKKLGFVCEGSENAPFYSETMVRRMNSF